MGWTTPTTTEQLSFPDDKLGVAVVVESEGELAEFFDCLGFVEVVFFC
jgi:hypothetical protein